MELTCDTIRPWPSPAGGELELAGWLDAAAEFGHVVVELSSGVRCAATLDDREDAIRGRPRRWRAVLSVDQLSVAPDASAQVIAADRSGQTAKLRVDSLPSPPVQPWSLEAYRAALETQMPLLVCHHPTFDGHALVGDPFVVEGWAYAPAGIEDVAVQLDEQEPILGRSSLPTAGLVALLGGWPGLERAGFRVLVSAGAAMHGVRRLTVSARTVDGTTLEWATKIWIDPSRLYSHALIRVELTLKRTLPLGSISAPRLLVWPLWPSAELALTLQAQVYPRFSVAEDENLDLNQGLVRAAETGNRLTVFVGKGAELRAGALTALATAAANQPSDEAFFANHDRRGEHGRRDEPCYKPAWSPELMLAIDQIGPLLALRPQAARAVLAQGEPVTGLYDLALRMLELGLPVGHVPTIAATLDPRVGVCSGREARAAIEGLGRRQDRPVLVEELDATRRRVSWPSRTSPLVTIVIPTGGAEGMIVRCLDSIAECSTYRQLEVVLVDTSPSGLAAQLSPTDLPTRKFRTEGAFNFSAACNLGAAQGSGEVLLFLNDDTEVLAADFIERMLDHALDTGVGPVGAKLLYPNQTIQHGGVLVNLAEGRVSNMLVGLPGTAQGPAGVLGVVRNCSAVTGACVMLARSQFELLGGFDESFALEYGDVDLCLRARSAGQRVVWTPHAVLLHHESISRRSRTNMHDLRLFKQRWQEEYSRGDPFYPTAFDSAGLFVLD